MCIIEALSNEQSFQPSHLVAFTHILFSSKAFHKYTEATWLKKYMYSCTIDPLDVEGYELSTELVRVYQLVGSLVTMWKE